MQGRMKLMEVAKGFQLKSTHSLVRTLGRTLGRTCRWSRCRSRRRRIGAERVLGVFIAELRAERDISAIYRTDRRAVGWRERILFAGHAVRVVRVLNAVRAGGRFFFSVWSERFTDTCSAVERHTHHGPQAGSRLSQQRS